MLNNYVNVSNIIAEMQIPELNSAITMHFEKEYTLSFFDEVQMSIKSYCQNNNEDYYIKNMKSVFTAIVNEIMNANHHILDVEHIFFIYTYVDQILTYKYISYIYEYLSVENREILNSRLLIFIYINMLKYTNDYHTEKIDQIIFKKHFKENIKFVNALYDSNYITNPLYSKNSDIENEDYYTISLFDFFVHGTYVIEYSHLGNFMIEIIMYNNDAQKYSIEDWNGLFANFVNIDSLYMLDSYTKNIGHLCIESMDNHFNEEHFYDFYFLYYFNVYYLSLLENKADNADYLEYLNEDLLNMWIEKDVKIINISNTFIFDDLVQFLKDIVHINSWAMINHIIQILESSDLTYISHTYIVTMLLRMIYYRLPKYQKEMVKYNKVSNQYYIDYYEDADRISVKFEHSDYITDVKEFISLCSDPMQDYIGKYVKHYVEILYPELKSIENRCCTNSNSCSICMEDVVSGDISICYGCKNIFHKKCQSDLFASRHQFCPLCRRCIYSTMMINLDIRYELFSKLM